MLSLRPMLNLATFRTNRAARATGLAFAGSGIIFGTWAALIPFIKIKFGLDEAQLGLLLLCPPAGIVAANPLSVPMLARFGAVRTTIAVLVAGGMALILPVAIPAIWGVAPALVILGGCMAVLNVAMNTCAALLEQHAGVRIISTCHGLWSAGAMTGSALAGAAMGLGTPAILYVSALAAAIALLAWKLSDPLREVPETIEPLGGRPEEKQKTFQMPNQALWLLIIISLCTNLTEGAMSDWAAVFMRQEVGAGETLSAWGFSVYAFFMAGGRFLGDGVVVRVGASRALRIGGITAVLGLLPAVFFPHPVAVLAGFALVGAGVSLGAPILYGAAAKVPGMSKGAGLATMNTFAMMAFLGGPALIGFIAQGSNLHVAFGVVALLALVWVWKAGRVEHGA